MYIAFGIPVPETSQANHDYIADEFVTIIGSPFALWKEHEGKYPFISAMAQDILAIPATSTPSERVGRKYRG